MNLRSVLPTTAIAASVVLCSFGAVCVEAQEATAPESAPTSELFWHEAPTLAPVQLVFPTDFVAETPHTLVVALHGFGGTADRFRLVADELAVAGFLVAVPEATYAVDAGGTPGFDWTLAHRDDDDLVLKATRLLCQRYLPAVVSEIKARYAIDHVYTLGFSQGAVVALLTGINNPTAFDGIVAFGLPAFRRSWFTSDVLASGHHLRVFLSHGEKDERAALDLSKQAREVLVGAGYDVALRVFDGAHTVPRDQLALAEQWIRDVDSKK